MATQLEIVNKLQRRLRETVTSSVSTNSYSVLLADFVNDALSFINNKWLWTAYETTSTASVTSSTEAYTLTTDSITKDAWLIRYRKDNSPLVYDTTNTHQLKEIAYSDYLYYINGLASGKETLDLIPSFAIAPNHTDGTLKMWFSAYPSSTVSVTSYWYNPQQDLAVDGTADSTEILIPDYPVYLYALMLALNERGEEIGEPGNLAETRAMEAIASAIEADMQVNKEIEAREMTNLEYLRTRFYGDV